MLQIVNPEMRWFTQVFKFKCRLDFIDADNNKPKKGWLPLLRYLKVSPQML